MSWINTDIIFDDLKFFEKLISLINNLFSFKRGFGPDY